MTFGRLDAPPLDASITVDATGTQLSTSVLFLDETLIGAGSMTTTGMATETCNDWSGTGTVRITQLESADPFGDMWGLSACTNGLVLCAQQ